MYYLYIMLNQPKAYLGEITTKDGKTIDICSAVELDGKEYRILNKRKVGEESFIFIVEEW